MLYILDPYIEKNGVIEWHVGDPPQTVPPAFKSRMLEFRADGDELDFLLAALRITREQKR